MISVLILKICSLILAIIDVSPFATSLAFKMAASMVSGYQIKAGMTELEVSSILGDPVDSCCFTGHRWVCYKNTTISIIFAAKNPPDPPSNNSPDKLILVVREVHYMTLQDYCLTLRDYRVKRSRQLHGNIK